MTNLYVISEYMEDDGKVRKPWTAINMATLKATTTGDGLIVGTQSSASGTTVKGAIDADSGLSAGVKQILKDVFDYLVEGGIIVDTDE